MRRVPVLLMLVALAACSTPRNPYYPDLEMTRRAREEPLTASEPNGLLKLLEAVLGALAKNT